MMKFATSTSFLPEGLPQCMVISDYCHGQLEVMGGDYVTLFGKDGDGLLKKILRVFLIKQWVWSGIC